MAASSTTRHTTDPRQLEQYGWRTGPVECRCSRCGWSDTFIAANESVPLHIAADFDAHQCLDSGYAGNDNGTNDCDRLP